MVIVSVSTAAALREVGVFDMVGELNWGAIGLAALAYFLLGALWFTPLFGKVWD